MKQGIFILISIILYSCNSKETEIYQWRGDNRAGIYNEKGLLKIWPEEGPAELWSAEGIGNGYGSPTVTESELFITGETDSLAWIYCFDLKGALIWKQQYGKEWARHYPGSRSAPTVAGDLVYAETGMGQMACMKRSNGEVVWTRDYIEDFGGILPYHGYSEAPAVDGDQVFCTPGGNEHNVVALNRHTGVVVWSCKGVGERMAYNPGNIIQLPSRKLYVTFSAYNLMGIDTQTGELLWTHPQYNTPVEKREPGIGDTHSNNVVYEGGYIYYAAGDGNGGVKLELSADGSQVKEVWRNPAFDSYMGGFVKMGDYLYGCGTRKKDIKSIHASTGQMADSLKINTGAVVAAGDMLYYYNFSGDLSLISFSDGKMQQQSSFKIARGTKEHFAHPVIKNGILYQRRGNTLMAFNIRS
jgi:outer membrane protein assembly factor BamB